MSACTSCGGTIEPLLVVSCCACRARRTGLTRERLHPILSQLVAGGLVQTARPVKAQPGQPAGDRYCLTADGLASAAVALAAARPDG